MTTCNQIAAFLESSGYRHTRLRLETIGDYDPRDSEWNYSDIPHLNVVHTQVESIPLYHTGTHLQTINLQRIAPLLKVPVSLFMEHRDASCHDYAFVILWVVVLVHTEHCPHEDGCRTITTYRFFYQGALGWILARLAKKATRKNYQILMDEDLPMRRQRGMLRRKGCSFSQDRNDLISFTDSMDLSKENVDAGGRPVGDDGSFGVDVSTARGLYEIDDLFIRVEWDETSISLYPLICPHEGAALNFDCPVQKIGTKRTVRCPWHGKKLQAITQLPRSEHYTGELDFCHQDIRVLYNGETLSLARSPKPARKA